MPIEFSKSAKKELERLPVKIKHRIRDAVCGLAENPPRGDIKTLEGFSDGRKRLRVGQYRVVYKYLDDGKLFIYVIKIGVRGDIYK